MARLWTCGFEMQSVATGVEWSVSSGAATNGTPEVSTTIKRRGTASLRFNPAAGNEYIEMQLDAGTVKRTFHRFYLYVATMPDVDVTVYSVGQSGYFPGACRLKANGTLTLRDGFTSTDLGTPSTPLQTGRWYRVELDYTDTAGTAGSVTGAFKGYLDGTLFADTLCSNINGWSRVRIGPQTPATTCDVYVDDVAVNDTAGSVQNGLPGAGCVVHLYPDGAGDSSLWDVTIGGTAGQANNWTRVSQRVPDDGASYNQTASLGTTTIDEFALESTSGSGIGAADQINVVQVGGRVSSDAVTAASIVYRLKSQSGGVAAESGSVSVNTTTWQTNNASTPRNQRLTSYTDPQDGSAWTAAKLDNAQIGYRTNVSQTTVRRVSGVWAVVDFVPRYDLGVARSTDDALILGYERSADPAFSLKDDFDDGTVDYGRWPNSFGYHVESGGRAQTGLDTNYNGFSSAKRYRIADSKVVVQVFPPAMPDDATEAWMQLLVLSNTAGTDLGWSIEVRTGEISAFNRTGYWDPEASFVAYDPVDHAWLQIAESGGTVTWSTSPDGHTWTPLRTVPTPTWAANDGDIELQMISHRADGVNNYGEWDNFNVLPDTEVGLGTASSSNTARGVTRRKRTATAPGSVSNTAHALTTVKRTGLGQALTATAADALVSTKTTGLGRPSSSVTAGSLQPVRRVPVGPGSVGHTGHGLTPAKSTDLGNAARTSDRAFPLSTDKRSWAGASGSVDAGHSVRAAHNLDTGLAGEVSNARPVFPVKSGGVALTVAVDTANPVSIRKSAALGAAASGGVSRGLAASHRYRAAQAAVQALGEALTGRKKAQAGAATARGAAHALHATGRATLGGASTTGSGHMLTLSKVDPRSTPAEMTTLGHAVASTKRLTLGAARETASGNTPAGRRKTSRLGVAPAALSGVGVGAAKTGHLGSAQSTHTAHTPTADKLKHLGRSTDAARAWALDSRRTARLDGASVTNLAPALTPSKTRNLATCAAADSAAGVAFSKLRPTGSGAVAGGGHSVIVAKRVLLGVARGADEAFEVSLARINRALNRAAAADRALPLNVHKQRPADRLVPGRIEPGLTPTSSGPGLKARSTGPGLTAGHTTGGS